MPIPANGFTRAQRRDLLAKLEAFAVEFRARFDSCPEERRNFWCYMNFCSPMVLDLVAWERIHVVDLQQMPAVKQLFMEVTQAAHRSYWDKGYRDSEADRGNPRRKFAEISEAELAANILPRLEHILYSWGVSYDHIEDKFTEREHTEAEIEQLTKYYGSA